MNNVINFLEKELPLVKDDVIALNEGKAILPVFSEAERIFPLLV